MSDMTVTCPACKKVIPLTESLLAPLLETTRKQLSAEEARKAKLSVSTELEQKDKALAELNEVLEQRSKKLAEAQNAQAELEKMKRDLEDQKREMNLTVEKRVTESLTAEREKARKEAEEKLGLRVLEKEQVIASMQREIEALKRKAEQGSEQLQGEAQELALEAALREKFPRDTIEPVPKGEHGGDVLQHVFGPLPQACGVILWESKRTKNWVEGWLPKLREDQRAAKADIAILISQTLPKGVDTFDLVEGVWVTHPRTAIAVAGMMRQLLIDVGAARKASDGQQTKAEMVYQYLTGKRFRQRIQAMHEAFTAMQEDLKKEKAVIQKVWAKREQEIERMLEATVGVYGDVQGIVGRTLQEIEGMELPALDPPPEQRTEA